MWKMYVLRSDIHCVKYAKNKCFLWSVFSRLQFCPYAGKYRYDSVLIWENTDQKMSAFPHALRSDKDEITVSN